MFHRDVAIQQIVQHLGGVAVQGVAIPAAAGRKVGHNIPKLGLKAREFGRDIARRGITFVVVDTNRRSRPLMAAENAPWHIFVAVGFMGHIARRQEALRFDHPHAAAILARAGEHIVTDLIAVADHGQLHAKIFKRVVAGVAHQLFNGIRPV